MLLNYGAFRPRTLFHILKEFKAHLAPILLQDLDCVIIDLIESNIQLINVYNTTYANIPDSIATIQRNSILPNSLAINTIVLGDFNTHHLW